MRADQSELRNGPTEICAEANASGTRLRWHLGLGMKMQDVEVRAMLVACSFRHWVIPRGCGRCEKMAFTGALRDVGCRSQAVEIDAKDKGLGNLKRNSLQQHFHRT